MSVVNSSSFRPARSSARRRSTRAHRRATCSGIVLQINRNPALAAVDDMQRETVLAALRQTGFITYPDKVAAANTAIVVTGGRLGDDAGNAGPTVARFAAALAAHGAGTVLAGADGSASGTSAVAVVRADSGMAGAVSTVDDVDMRIGADHRGPGTARPSQRQPHRPVRHGSRCPGPDCPAVVGPSHIRAC